MTTALIALQATTAAKALLMPMTVPHQLYVLLDIIVSKELQIHQQQEHQIHPIHQEHQVQHMHVQLEPITTYLE